MLSPEPDNLLDARLQKLVDTDIENIRTGIDHVAHSQDMTETGEQVAVRELSNLISTALMLQTKKEHPYDVEKIIEAIKLAAQKLRVDLDKVMPPFTAEQLFAEILKGKPKYSPQLAEQVRLKREQKANDSEK